MANSKPLYCSDELTDAERQYAPPADESRTAHLRTLAAITSRKPSPQALAARKRATQRNREMADLRADRLTTLANTGDAVAVQLLGVSRGQ